jgi:hypothetical protein
MPAIEAQVGLGGGRTARDEIPPLAMASAPGSHRPARQQEWKADERGDQADRERWKKQQDKRDPGQGNDWDREWGETQPQNRHAGPVNRRVGQIIAGQP